MKNKNTIGIVKSQNTHYLLTPKKMQTLYYSMGELRDTQDTGSIFNIETPELSRTVFRRAYRGALRSKRGKARTRRFWFRLANQSDETTFFPGNTPVTALRIGCQTFRGEALKILRLWAGV